jgi:hypothetical protein
VRRSARLLAVAAACAFAAGCAAPAGEGDVRRTATDWLTAAGAGDAGRLCALMTPAAAQSVTSGKETCEQAVGDLDLPGGSTGEIELWSDEAQVRAGTETLFLVRLATGWRVNAAGCRPQTDRPYDCDVAG